MENLIVNSFLKRYGKQTFSKIEKIIQNELKKSNVSVTFDSDYVRYIFEFAAYDYCGLDHDKITVMISKMGNDYIPNLDISKLKEIHNNSIQEIQSYLKNQFNNILEKLK